MALRLVKGGTHRTARRGEPGGPAFLLVGAGGSVVEALEWETVSADPVPGRIGAGSEHDPLLRAIGEAVLLARQSRRPSARSIEISLERPHVYAIAAAPIAGKGRGRTGEVAVIVSEAPAAQAGRAEGKVMRQLGHDLRTPLTSISGAVELLQSGRLGPMADQQVRVLGMMQKGVDAMVRLIDEATAPFRQDAGMGLVEELEDLARESGGGAGERREKDRHETESPRGPRADPKRGRR